MRVLAPVKRVIDYNMKARVKVDGSPLGRALAQMGKAIDLRESAPRTESQSTIYSLALM